jgi:diguanylate cyclase (GGDEF)-like protein
MESFVPLSLDWLICLPMALIGVLTFGLLECSLRRMRSHDRLTVVIWWFAGACTVASGLWATWAMGLATLVAPPAFPTLQFLPSWLAALAIGAGLLVTSLHGASRYLAQQSSRGAAHAALSVLGWLAMFFLARRSVAAGMAPSTLVFGLPALAVSVATILAGQALSHVVTLHPRWRRSGIEHLWGRASLMGLTQVAAVLVSLQALNLAPPGAGEVVTPVTLVGTGGILVVCGLALLLVCLGLVGSWLDTHAHVRNRLLARSLGEANEKLRAQAHSDPLTRMPNRLMFEERMTAALKAVGDHPGPCSIAVMFIDLDGFKPINDSFGHVAGDAVLREIGRRLQLVARTQDIVARVGGDEFLLMMMSPGNEAVAASTAQRVLQALNEPLTLPNNVAVNLSGSIGIVLYPEHGPPGKLIANADAAMYAAKRAGGSTYAFFEPRMELDAREQLALQHDLRQAIERNELQLYYQPKIHAKSGQITGVEALLRWQHPVRGFVGPALFIPIAERFGLIGTIGYWVIDEACRQLRDWQRQGLMMRVAVNLSVHQLRQEDLVERVQMAVNHYGVNAQLLTFEITESVAMEDTQETMRAFSQLAAAGVRLSIDDFGTGYSSLSYLRKLPAKELKIDQSFVQDLGTSQDALAVVDAVIKLAHALGLKVVAEGVETSRQRDILLRLQCDEMQGYLFARPMAARMLTLWAMGDTQSVSHASDQAQAGRDDFRPSLYMEDGLESAIDLLR